MESANLQKEKVKKNGKGTIVIKSFGWKSAYFEPVKIEVDIEKVWSEFSDKEREMVIIDKDNKFIFAIFPNTDTPEDEILNVKVKLAYALTEKIYNSLYFELLDKNGECIEQSNSVESVRRFETQRRIEEARKEGYKKGYENGCRDGKQGL